LGSSLFAKVPNLSKGCYGYRVEAFAPPWVIWQPQLPLTQPRDRLPPAGFGAARHFIQHRSHSSALLRHEVQSKVEENKLGPWDWIIAPAPIAAD
jgi:hypothetical protein